MMLITDWLMDH